MHARPAAERVLELVGTDDKFRNLPLQRALIVVNLPSRRRRGTGVLGEDGDGGKRWWVEGLPFLGDGLAREEVRRPRERRWPVKRKRVRMRHCKKHVRG